MTEPAPSTIDLGERLREFWRDEVEAERVYGRLAEREEDPQRKEVLRKLADTERRHAERWAERLRALGQAVPAADEVKLSAGWKLSLDHAPMEVVLQRMETEERDNLGKHTQALGDPETDRLAAEIATEDEHHSVTLRELLAQSEGGKRSRTSQRLDRIMGRETWHKKGSGWIGGAIYGVNDGLGAVFGIVAGVSGATLNSSGGSHAVLLAGLAGTIASAASMGAGAFLASKSEAEVVEAELTRERNEFETDPDLEREEMSLMYQLKGLTEAEANRVVESMAADPERFVREHSLAELEVSAGGGEKPLQAGVAAALSTAVGAILPVLPFFWMRGFPALIAAATISLLAHFAVGAAKTILTMRNWFMSGLEMTAAGVFVGVVTYVIGVLVQPLVG